jgi:hypothetical protein
VTLKIFRVDFWIQRRNPYASPTGIGTSKPDCAPAQHGPAANVDVAGATLTTIRDLIAVPSETEQALREYATEHPEERQAVERVIEFQGRALQEFERLLAAQIPGQ